MYVWVKFTKQYYFVLTALLQTITWSLHVHAACCRESSFTPVAQLILSSLEYVSAACRSGLLTCCSVIRTEVTEPVLSSVTAVLDHFGLLSEFNNDPGPKWPRTEVTIPGWYILYLLQLQLRCCLFIAAVVTAIVLRHSGHAICVRTFCCCTSCGAIIVVFVLVNYLVLHSYVAQCCLHRSHVYSDNWNLFVLTLLWDVLMASAQFVS